MKRALVTGGCGFVGRRFVCRLLVDGWYVQIVDDLSAGIDPWEWDPRPRPKNHHNFAACDIRNWMIDHPMTAMATYDLIIHCAAVVGGRLKIDGDPLAVATDLVIDSDFFNWVVKAKNRPKVVYFSSSAVYPVELQTRELHCSLVESLVPGGGLRIGMPDVSYGWSKLTGEMLAQWAVKQYGADVVIYRPFSGYGEDQSFDYPFPSIIRRVVNRENPITIWGSGEQCRDFIYVDDIVEAVMQTKDVLKPGEVLNLGTGIPTSFFELAWKAIGVTGSAIGNIDKDTTKPEGVFYRVADTYKLDQFYKPKVSLEEGIRRVAAHLKERSNA
jgi:UDP-glucose 4-epimerase